MVRRPYSSWADAGSPALEDVWRALRELRADPPGYATSSARKKVFSAALEQAEQLFTAAAAVGPASRPLLLFYGLSQAGRAVAACAHVSNDTFRLTGHGITANAMESSDLGMVTVRDSGKGAFTQLAQILHSRSLPDKVLLADLWSTVPDVRHWPLTSSTQPLLDIAMQTSNVPGGQLVSVVSGMPGRLRDVDGDDELEAEVRKWLASYPALGTYGFLPGLASWDEQWGTIGYRLTWAVESRDGAAEEAFKRIAPWRGKSLSDTSRFIHARLGEDGGQMHPLLAWWAVLYTLSMLARYEPGQWTAHIDVNRCRNAVAVEFLLHRALATVPELILATIEDLVR